MKCTIYAKKQFVVGPVDKRIFGSFVEQLGRAVYGGVYEVDHPTADEQGFRSDVIDLVRELNIPVIRFPGGNYVSNFNWEDSVGPKEQRPTRLDLAWRALDPNQFGLHEFMDWTKKVNSEAMMVVNLGTRGLAEARELAEYCNYPGGSTLSELRKSHGAEEPFNITMWGLGNEMDGPWQVGHKSAEEYGKLAAEAGKALKLLNPSLELIACGSSNSHMPTFPQWEETVLEHTYEVADYISLHMYFRNDDDDLMTFLAASISMDEFIETVVNVCDYVKAKKRSKKTMYLCFDEWNVWYHSTEKDREQPSWIVGPSLLEDVYTFEDALVVGCLLNSLLRRADRVKIACLAQLVNTIAPIMTETGGPAWRQTIYWPFYYASKYGRGVVLDVRAEVPTYENKTYGAVPYADTIIVHHPETNELVLFVVNRNPDEPLELDLNLSGFEGNPQVIEHVVLDHVNLKAVNTKEKPDEVAPKTITPADGKLKDLQAPPLSWNMVRIAL
ncbi:MAG: alpha-N-arabinofuranosidase [Sphaerochaetaceae bacterium]